MQLMNLRSGGLDGKGFWPSSGGPRFESRRTQNSAESKQNCNRMHWVPKTPVIKTDWFRASITPFFPHFFKLHLMLSPFHHMSNLMLRELLALAIYRKLTMVTDDHRSGNQNKFKRSKPSPAWCRFSRISMAKTWKIHMSLKKEDKKKKQKILQS